MRSDGRENVLGGPPALPRRALAGSVAGKALEALTLAGLVLLVPRALGAADYGRFAVALAIATGIATATGIGGPALFARVLGPLTGSERRELARTLIRRLGAVRAGVVAALALAARAAALLAPGGVTALQVVLVLVGVALGTAATLLSQLALGLERTLAWSLRYPLENGVIVAGALVLYPLAGLDGAIAAVVLGAAAALALGLATAGRALVRDDGDAATHNAVLPAGVLRFARLQAAGGALTQTVHRGAAPACALLGVGGAATGHAAIAAGAALAITYAVLQTTLVALPAAARAFARDPAGAEASLRRVCALAAFAVVPACALLALAAEPLLAFGLGEEFRDAAQPLRIALAAAALAPLWALATQLAALRERPQAVLAGATAGALTFALVAALALPGAGAGGAAAAMLAGVVATTGATFAALRVGARREAWAARAVGGGVSVGRER
jgi:O-antigen/teichoic acid export membrane protein